MGQGLGKGKGLKNKNFYHRVDILVRAKDLKNKTFNHREEK
jgi:hypothetical protein